MLFKEMTEFISDNNMKLTLNSLTCGAKRSFLNVAAGVCLPLTIKHRRWKQILSVVRLRPSKF